MYYALSLTERIRSIKTKNAETYQHTTLVRHASLNDRQTALQIRLTLTVTLHQLYQSIKTRRIAGFMS